MISINQGSVCLRINFIGNGGPGTRGPGTRERGTGSREQGAGTREQGPGNP
ncbi:MAG: AraC family transcriptional regulator [bacterium]